MKILIVDDNKDNIHLLEIMLKASNYSVVSAMDGIEALEKLRANGFDIIVSDILMPGMDGFQLCREVKEDEELKDIPFVFYTAAYKDEQDEELAMEVGGDKFIRKPTDPDVLLKIIQDVIRDAAEGKLKPKKPLLEKEEEVFKLYSERLVAKLEQKILDVQRENAQRKEAEEKLQKSLEGTIQALGQTTETRDPYTAGHQRRVTQLACAVAKEMDVSSKQIEGIRVAGLMHDIGKISVPAEILSKPGRLNNMEFSMIKAHPQAAYDILRVIDFHCPVADIVLQHHERLDGSGYPQGLKGEEILLEARILSVADVVEAMSSHRPYRPALAIEKTLEEIEKNKGTLYDPEAVDACLWLFTKGQFVFESQTPTMDEQRL